jgi:hypothetical protein
MKKQKVYVVCGFNDDWGHSVLGLYPTEEAALSRMSDVKDSGEFKVAFYNAVNVGANGVDLNILIQ